MTSPPSGPRGASVHPRVVLLSILCFWLVYFAIATIRAVIVGWPHQFEMLVARTIVTVASMAATYIVYLAVRPLAGRSLATNMTAIALLAIPASIAWSSINWMAFQQVSHIKEREKANRPIIIRTREDAERLREQADAAREAAQQIRDAVREAARESREAARESREATRESREATRESQEAAADAVKAAREAIAKAREQGIRIEVPPIAPVAPEPPQPPQADEAMQHAMTIQVGRSGSGDDDDDDHLSLAGQLADQAFNGYFFFIAWGALFLALSYAAAVRNAEREAAGYRAAARDAELRALRYQVNPHFLFNTLNSLSSLVLKDHRDEAERMILNLATFFRTSLTADPTEDVLLSEEIHLQRLYLDIEAVRFPERLIVNIAIPPSLLTACVPCLILQPLVENAIKYGVSRAKQPVTVFIAAREDSHGLVLTVEDDGDPMADAQPTDGTGVGLKNVTDRLKARFGDAAACRYGPLVNGGFSATIFMPLIRHGC